MLVRNLAYELVSALYATSGIAILAFFLLGGRLEHAWMLLRSLPEASSGVVTVSIGEKALHLFGKDALATSDSGGPEHLHRGLAALLVTALAQAGARVIVFDVVIEEEGVGYGELAAAVAASPVPVVVAGRHSEPRGEDPGFMVGPPASLAVEAAYANLWQEQPFWTSEDAWVVRGVQLASCVDLPAGDSRVTPSLALAAAWHASAARGADLSAELGACDAVAPLRVGDTTLSPEELLGLNSIHFRGAAGRDGIDAIDAARILLNAREGLPPDPSMVERVRDRVVIVGRTDESAGDLFITPYAFPSISQPDMRGLDIQAQIVDMLLSARLIRHAPPWVGWFTAALVAWLVLRSSRRRAPHRHAAQWAAASGGLAVLGFVVFQMTDGLVLPVGPAIGVIVATSTVVHLGAWVRALG